MRVLALIALIVALIVVIVAPNAPAANYGCVSKAQCRKMEHLVYKTFGRGYAGQCFIRIMYRESGGNPRAANYTDANGGSYGLLQLNGIHRWRGESWNAFLMRMYNPVTHLQAAKRLYLGSGFAPWRGC